MENAKDTGQREAVTALLASAKVDPDLRAELEANPQEVFMREVGLTATDFEQQLGDQELSAVAGGSNSEAFRRCDEPGCGFQAQYHEALVVHRIFAHGKFFS